MRLLLVGILILLTSGHAVADDKKPASCPEQLAQAAQHANNLTLDRNNKEYTLAKVQVELQQWKQQAAMVQKQMDEMKKAAESKPDEKKPE